MRVGTTGDPADFLCGLTLTVKGNEYNVGVSLRVTSGPVRGQAGTN